MKTKNKRNIGILLAAIMVISVFAVVMPAMGGFGGDPDYPPVGDVSITEPEQDECVRGVTNLTWTPAIGPVDWTYAYTLSQNGTGHWVCLDEKLFGKACGAPGCTGGTWDTSAIACRKDIKVVVWNGSQGSTPWGTPVNRNYTNFSVDNVDPCIVCNSPANGTWFNGTAAEGDAELNVSACDNCCGIYNISADVSVVSDIPSGTIEITDNRSSTGTYICGLPGKCIGWYYNTTILWQNLVASDNTTVVAVTVRDNATDENGVRGSATCAMEFGVDPTAPTPPTSIGCDNSTGGAIVIQWSGAVDPAPPAHPSGLHYYKIYYTKTNATGTYTGLLKSGAVSPYTFNPAVSEIAEYDATYTFNVTAVDYARNVGTHSVDTPEQILDPGVPSQVVITNPPEGDVVTACTDKDLDYIQATIKDQFGVPVGGENYEVHVAATKGVTCPWKIAPIPDDGKVESAYKAPQWVPDCEPVAINVSLWNGTGNNATYISSSIVNIEICPKQAHDIELTADPAMIPTNGSTSTITVQLIDENDYAVHLTGVDIVVTTNAGTFENGEQEVSGYTDETGTFIATLTSSKTPTLATVTADANSHWWMKTVDVAFAGSGSYDIPLCAGWNLISLPLVPENTYAGTVLSVIAGNLTYAFAYDGCTGNWTSGSFTLAGPWTGDLVTMNVLRGYWLLMGTPATLTVTGFTMTPAPGLPPVLPVCEGWNLVGYYVIPPDKVMTAGNYYNVAVNYNMLAYDCASQGYFSVGAGDNLGSGKGYWMNANANGEITPQEWL